jgi:hypothetical protein
MSEPTVRKKLNEHNRDLLALVARSIHDDLGWVTVSKACWPLMEKAERELFEIRERPEGNQVRLTQEGKVVLKWLTN